MKTIQTKLAAAIVGGSLLHSPVSFADFSIEEIIVTAQKRETSLQETPIAITAMTSDDLEKQQIDGVQDVQHQVPNMVVADFVDQAQISLRGVGTEVATILADPSVASHVDGVYRGGLSSSAQLFFDMERLEVLRGPQGTLYGRNTTGGSVNIITKLPGDSPTFEMDALAGNFGRLKTKLAADLPVSDTFKVRAAYLYDDNDGVRENEFNGDDIDDAHIETARIVALFEPADDLEVILRADWYESDSGGAAFAFTDLHPTSTSANISAINPGGALTVPSPLFGGQSAEQAFGLNLAQGGTVTTDPQKLNLDRKSEYLRNGSSVNATVTWDQEDFQVKSVTSYYQLTSIADNVDIDGVEVDLFSQVLEQGIQEFSQEINISGVAFDDKLDWIVGAFYYEANVESFGLFELPGFQATFEGLAAFSPDTGFTPLPSGALAFGNPRLNGQGSAVPFIEYDADQDIISTAVFGQATYALSDDLRATVGLRWTRDEKDLTQSVVNNLGADPGCRDIEAEDNWEQVTGKIGVDYNLSDDALLYGTISRGFKAGGFNAGSCANSYDPEVITAYDVGVKTDWLDNKLQLNAALFYYDYTDLHTLIFQNNVTTVENAATADIYGLEVEWIAQVSENLRFDGHFSLLDAEYKDYLAIDPMNPETGFDCNAFGSSCTQDLSGNSITRAPDYSAVINATYTFDLAEKGLLDLRIEYAYTDDIYNTAFNNEFDKQDAFGLTNIRAIWTPEETADGSWRVQAFIENAGDKDYAASSVANPTLGGVTSQFAPPRTFGIQASYRWGKY